MKYLLFLLILTISLATQGAIVRSFSELRLAVDNQEELIQIQNDLVADSDIDIHYNCQIIPLTDITIDLSNNYTISIYSSTKIGDPFLRHSITFLHGMGSDVCIYSLYKDINCFFYKCSFLDSVNSNGLFLRNAYYRLTCTCVQCIASNNFNDGFSMHKIGTHIGECILFLVNSIAADNDSDNSGSPCGDGVTAHDSSHTIYIKGGRYFNNGKSGIALVGGASAYITDAVFFDNGFITPLADFYIEGGGYFEIKKSHFFNTKQSAKYFKQVYIVDSSGVIQNCIFENINNVALFAKYRQSAEQHVMVERCDFVNNRRHIDVRLYDGVTIRACIFAYATEYAILDNLYHDNLQNTHNCFYDNNADILSNNQLTSIGPTDMEIDPLFATVGTFQHGEFYTCGDYHLQSQAGRWSGYEFIRDKLTSPCIAWQLGAYAGTKQASLSFGRQCNELLDGDVNQDCVVNEVDLSLLMANWLSSSAIH